MSTPITARQIVDRIHSQLAVPTPQRSADGFAAGEPSSPVTGIATTFTATLEVLHHAVERGRNLIVARESPYWSRSSQKLAGNPLFALKQEYIAKHGLVIYRLQDVWQARPVDAQLTGLAKALGWDRYRAERIYYQLPPASLDTLARDVSTRLKIHAARVIGDPATKVTKVALTHGMIRTPELAKVLGEPGVDAVVIGEPVEWEASPYFQDVIASGRKAGLIALGQEASEEPGCGEMAAWLKSFISEVPVEWIPAGEPFGARRWS
jgi:putative NIF3 family GTP cyclohydrolase 1 type 2